MAGVQENSLFLAENRALKGREGINLLVHACHSNSLSFSFLLFKYSSFLFFSLNTWFLFSRFSCSSRGADVLPCTWQGPLFIVLVMIKFYYFSP